MKCPYCGKEMKPGYIQCRDGLYWAEELRPVAALPPLLFGDCIRLGRSDTVPMFGGHAAEAYCCPDCKKIIVEY